MAAGDGTLVPTLSFPSWPKEGKSETELGLSVPAELLSTFCSVSNVLVM